MGYGETVPVYRGNERIGMGGFPLTFSKTAAMPLTRAILLS